MKAIAASPMTMLALLASFGLGIGACGDDDDETATSQTPGDDDSGDDDSSSKTPLPDDGLTIYDIQDPTAAAHPNVGDPVAVRGVIVTTKMIKTGNSTVNDGFWVSEPAGGPFGGIYVYAKNLGVTVQPGDLLDIAGNYQEYYDESQIVATVVMTTGTASLPTPYAITPADLDPTSASVESFEGVIVDFPNVVVSSADLGYGDFGVTGKSGGYEVTVDNLFAWNYSFTPSSGFEFDHLSGVVRYTFEQYRLEPRMCDDLIDSSGESVCGDATPTEPPSTPTQECLEEPHTIEQIQNPEDPCYLPEDTDVVLENVIVTTPVYYSGTNPIFFVESAGGGEWSGVSVYAPKLDVTGIEPGAVVSITGYHDEYYDQTQVYAKTLEVTGSDDVPDPILVTPGEVNTDGTLSEAYEGVLIAVEDVVITEPTFVGTDNNDHGDFLVAPVDDLTTELVVGWSFRYDFACPDEGGVACETDQREEGVAFDRITGVLGYSFYNFRLQPRSDADLELANVEPVDSDGDTILDKDDNCPTIPNKNQADADNDGVGDVCDNCPSTKNTDQADPDEDGIGSACDTCPTTAGADQTDTDHDGFGDICDNCPTVASDDQTDVDGDGLGAACDNCPTTAGADQTDTDGDGVGDLCDNCEAVSNPDQEDPDSDGIGSACDNCPTTANTDQADPDTDGIGSACDNCPDVANDQTDADMDGVGDVCDNCPDAVNPDQSNIDDDGQGDVCDLDRDNDGIPEGDGSNPCTGGVTESCDDNCPTLANPDQVDADGDGLGDLCRGAPHIVLSEVCIKPSANEFVELYNPTEQAISLENYYLWNGNSSSLFYYQLGSEPSLEEYDFAATFPEGTVLEPGAYLTVAIGPAAGFLEAYTVEADFALRGDGTGNTLNMVPAWEGSIMEGAALFNAGEDLILFVWDGVSDLVWDVDYVIWGDTSAAVDKTGVTVGESTYHPDTAVTAQIFLPEHAGEPDEPATWQSYNRIDAMEDGELFYGGNGLSGHDETSEPLTTTFEVGLPSPGTGPVIVQD